jgi:hypothetical protein
VALYRGLPYELPFGLKLYSEQYAAPVQVTSLPRSDRDSATDHTLRFHDDAASLVKHLAAVAKPPKPVREPQPPQPQPQPQPKPQTNKRAQPNQKQARKSNSAPKQGTKQGAKQQANQQGKPPQ